MVRARNVVRSSGKRARSAKTGKFVTKAMAARHPRATVTEGGSNKGSGTHHRSATTGEYVTGPAGRSSPSITGPDALAVTGGNTRLVGGSKRPVVVMEKKPVKGLARGRSGAADDPLAPERTRWLVDTVGGVRRLADMLGVSPSQPSRWAKGEERPNMRAAPLLIDFEHVLARVRLVWAEPAATTWMTSANSHLADARPVDVLVLSGPGPVLEALDAETWGGFA